MYKLVILLATVLLAAGCSNETTDPLPADTLRMGRIDIVTKNGIPMATPEWTWQNGDQLTATANGQSSSYTWSNGSWGKTSNAGFTIEAIGLSTISLAFGNKELTTDQTTAANYRQADYITGNGELDFLTINGTLTHQYTDVVVTLQQGGGWENTVQFTNALAAASFEFGILSSTATGNPYHESEALFRAVIPPDRLPTGTAVKLGTLTFGSANTPAVLQNRKAQVVYTNNFSQAELKGSRLTVTVTLDIDCQMSTGITFQLWEGQTISDLPAI